LHKIDTNSSGIAYFLIRVLESEPNNRNFFERAGLIEVNNINRYISDFKRSRICKIFIDEPIFYKGKVEIRVEDNIGLKKYILMDSKLFIKINSRTSYFYNQSTLPLVHCRLSDEPFYPNLDAPDYVFDKKNIRINKIF
jgi:hypothetical protein